MRHNTTQQRIWLVVAAIAVACLMGVSEGYQVQPKVYVPYHDVAQLIGPGDKLMLMDRVEFETLLAAAEARGESAPRLGQVRRAEYTARVVEEKLLLSGVLEVYSLSEGAVAVPLGFAEIGLTEVLLDGEAAALGYNREGRLTVIVTGGGEHRLEIKGSTGLNEIASGGMQFGISVPAAVAGRLTLTAAGDLEVNATAPVAETVYDAERDQTEAEITVGGSERLTVVLQGNGRRQDDRAIMLGESVTVMELNRAHEIMNCVYTVQVLRRGVRRLEFELPEYWTISAVSCEGLERWSVDSEAGGGKQDLTVNLRSAATGAVVVQIQAMAERAGQGWQSSRTELREADYQRGYLLVSTDEGLHLQGERLTEARREEASALAEMGALGMGRWYFHWGENWSVELETAELALRRSVEGRVQLSISKEQLVLSSIFEVTAIEREMYEMGFVIPAARRRWQVSSVLVNSQLSGFEYRVESQEQQQILWINMEQPIQSEKLAQVSIILQHVPEDWQWFDDSEARAISAPLIQAVGDTVSGMLLVSSEGDLDAEVMAAAGGLEPVAAGRMASMGIEHGVQYAYSYNEGIAGEMELRVSRRRARIGAESVGLVDMRVGEYYGYWRITYLISRARANSLFLLADKELGENFDIDSPEVSLSSKHIVASGEDTLVLSAAIDGRYNLWQLHLDMPMVGEVSFNINYKRSSSAAEQVATEAVDYGIALVRPICREQITEHLALQASEEMAVSIEADGVKEIDAIELPPLPVYAGRILAAYELEPASTAEGGVTAVRSVTEVYENYEIPSVLAVSGEFTTYLDVPGNQRTQATFLIANAGAQFLTMRLPKNAELWSLRVRDKQAKPQRTEEGDYQVPLELAQTSKPISVKIVYACPAAGDYPEALELGGVELPGIEVNQVRWNVVPAPGYQITGQLSQMESRDLSRPTPAFRQAFNFIGDNIWGGFCMLQQFGRAREMSKSVQTASNLGALGRSLVMYQSEFKGAWPESLDRLVETEGVDPMSLYDTDGYRFEYFPPRAGESVAGDRVVAQSSVVDGRRSVLQADGVVRTVQVGVRGYDEYSEHHSYSGEQDASRRALNAQAMVPTIAGEPPVGGAVVSQEQVETEAPEKIDARLAPPQVQVTGGWYHGGGIYQSAQEGRYTLPVDLVATAGAGPAAAFTGLGAADLVIELTRQGKIKTWWGIGFVLVILLGVMSWSKTVRYKAYQIVLVLGLASLLALWKPGTTYFANGAFSGGWCLVPMYLLIGLGRRAWTGLRLGGAAKTASVAGVLLILGGGVGLADAHQLQQVRMPQQAGQMNMPVGRQQSILDRIEQKGLPPVLYLYEGDANTLDETSKVLLSYEHYVQLWNKVHPEDPLEASRSGSTFSVADVQYRVRVQDQQLRLVLTASVTVYGKEKALLGLPLAGLAVSEVTVDGGEAKMQAEGGVLRLELAGDRTSQVALTAVGQPSYLGRRGSISFSVPPLPGGALRVVLEEDDLELEVEGIEGVLSRDGGEWAAPLGMARHLTLRWLPRMVGGRADRTLSATMAHDVYAFHWALVGVSRVTWRFSAGENDRFSLLAPAGVTLTDLAGANIRDHRVLGERVVNGEAYELVEVRLYRAVEKEYDLTVRWVGELGSLDEPRRLGLVQAADVGRESGTVTLHAAGSMEMKIVEMSGGRREDVLAGRSSASGVEAADRARPVAQYYWPYRPFSLSVQLSRQAVRPEINLDQLVRINTDQVQLLVQAKLQANSGRLFGADFSLPEGFELLSVVGAAVEDYYEQTNDAGRLLHVWFRQGQQQTNIVLVLVRRESPAADFAVPMMAYVDADGQVIEEQKGRVAIQVVKSLEGRTVSSDNLRAVAPGVLRDWLDEEQIQAVQFAYRYDRCPIALGLNIAVQPRRIRVENFTGVAVEATGALYTYRLRYFISGSPVDEIRFSMDSRFAPGAAVHSPALRNVTKTDRDDGRTEWKVSLVNEVTGTLDITVNFSWGIDVTTRVLEVPVLETDAVEEYHAIVAVQNLSRHEIGVGAARNLSDMPLSEQQRFISGEVQQSLQYVMQSYVPSWSLSLDVAPAPPAARRIQAVVDLMNVTTVIDRQGRCRYEMKIALQNRSEQFLRVKAPAGLKLWSAKVADQAVKPVVTAEATGEILIPLVKTSPGGLPYDVLLYLAGDVVDPLNGMTRIKPPAISIVDMPVTQTTWSLILPGGYRYLRPKGNMAAVAGTAELLSIGIEAQLEQLKRLDKAYRDVSVSGTAHSKETARYNWDVGNELIVDRIQQAQKFVEDNYDMMSDAEYERIKTKLGAQLVQQRVLSNNNAIFIEKQQGQTQDFVNMYLNESAFNTGVAEPVRNKALWEKPAFVGENEQQQIEKLKEELQSSLESQRQATPPSGQRARQVVTDVSAEEKIGVKAEDLLVSQVDQKAQMERLLENLSAEGIQQANRRTSQMQQQLSELTDNRMQRYFSSALSKTTGDYSEEIAGNMGIMGRLGEKGGMGGMMGGMGGMGVDRNAGIVGNISAGQPQGPPTAGGLTAYWPLDESAIISQPGRVINGVALDSLGYVQGAVAGSGPQNLSVPPLYVSGNTYSLPVNLPGGEVRLDFAHPSGEVELSILAIPVNRIHTLYGSVLVLAVSVVMFFVIAKWPRMDRREPLTWRRVLGYGLLAVLLTLILAGLGLLISVVIIIISEGFRQAAAHRIEAQD